MTLRLLLNGRFLERPVTGVERLAIELTRALRGVIDELSPNAVELAVAMPNGATVEQEAKLAGSAQPAIRAGCRRGQIWEQVDLPKIAPAHWLISPCNLGPLRRRAQALVICDAQVYLHPESYSLAFRLWYKVVLPLLARRVALLFTISNFSRDQLEQFGVARAGKAIVLPLGVDHLDRIAPDLSTLQRHGLAADGYILAIGSLAPHKNLVTLVKAYIASGVEQPLVIAGGGNARVFGDAGLPDHPCVRYLGRVEDGELKALYRGALAFACPSLTEGFGLTPLEAMASGCPLLATTGGAVPEVCGDAALYVDPLDGAGWVAAIRRIVRDDDLRADLVRRGAARAAGFRWRDAALVLLGAIAEAGADEVACQVAALRVRTRTQEVVVD